MIYLLFGEMGSGKNYIGELFADRFNCFFFDGDNVIPKEMKEKVDNFKFLGKKVINNYVDNHLIPAVRNMHRFGSVVVAQALYTRAYRRKFVEAFGSENVIMIHIRPESLLCNLRFLWKRRRGFRWALYFLLSKPFFQRPKVDVHEGADMYSVVNDYRPTVESQVHRLAMHIEQNEETKAFIKGLSRSEVG